MKNKFEELCESMGVLSQTRRMFYPKQIKFSDNFIKALKEEYFRQKLEEDANLVIRNRPEKFMKAIQFHVADFEKNTAQELEAARKILAKTQESTEQYKAKVKGDKSKGNEKEDKKGIQKRKDEINKEMMGLKKTISRPIGESLNDGSWQLINTPEDAVDYIMQNSNDPLVIKDNEIINSFMRKFRNTEFPTMILNDPEIPDSVKTMVQAWNSVK